jgi:hypothetical protein
MANKTDSTSATLTTRPSFGFVPGLANLALDAADRSQSTAIAVLQDARSELRSFVESSIDFAEKSTSALFRFARSVTKRVDDGVAETLSNTERLLTGAVKSARETTKSATDTANTAISGITGNTASA